MMKPGKTLAMAGVVAFAVVAVFQNCAAPNQISPQDLNNGSSSSSSSSDPSSGAATNPGSGTVNPSILSKNLTISNNTNNYNIFSAAGSPTGPLNVTVTINSGVVVGSASSGQPAMATGSFVAGSTITIINNGYIVGHGGDGGSSDGNGTNGGPALALNFPVTINNAGYIYGGGGGGGGGATGYAVDGYGNIIRDYFGNPEVSAPGGQGGGGCGKGAPNGGANSPGAGAPGGTQSNGYFSANGATGGGGGCGAAGSPGQSSNTNPGGQGGAAGAAIVKNGNSINWQAGSVSPHVAGAVN